MAGLGQALSCFSLHLSFLSQQHFFSGDAKEDIVAEPEGFKADVRVALGSQQEFLM